MSDDVRLTDAEIAAMLERCAAVESWAASAPSIGKDLVFTQFANDARRDLPRALAEVQRLQHENEMQKITISMLDTTTSDQLEIIERLRALLTKVANEAHMSRIETGFTDETWNEVKVYGD